MVKSAARLLGERVCVYVCGCVKLGCEDSPHLDRALYFRAVRAGLRLGARAAQPSQQSDIQRHVRA